MTKFQINKDLLVVKGFFFLWNAGAFTMLSFTPVYIKQLGYSSFALGIVCAVLPLCGMLAKPLMGMVADKFNCQKIIFLTAQLLTTIAFLSMIFLPEIPTSTSVAMQCNGSEVVLEEFGQNRVCDIELVTDEVFGDAVLCNLTCPLEREYWKTMCYHWGSNDYCKTHPDGLSFSTRISTKSVDQQTNCAYFIQATIFESNNTIYSNCSGHHKMSTRCSIQCNATDDYVEETINNRQHLVQQYQFWLILLAYLVAWSSQSVTNSIADAVCYQILGDKPRSYGYQRMWGSIGCGIVSIASGIMVDTFSESETKKNYNSVFLLGTVILILCIIVSSRIQCVKLDVSMGILKDIGRLLSKFPIWIFMMFCMIVGMCTALTWYFLLWYLEDLAVHHGDDMLSNMKTIEGLILGIQCLGGDLPFLFLSSWILKRMGHVNTMSFILFVVGTKFLLYSFLTNPWWCLPIEFLNGPTYGLFYATMTSYASIVASPGTGATTQGLVGAVFEGIGLSTGSLAGGLLFQQFGGAMTFRIFSIFTLIACCVHIIVQYYIKTDTDRGKGFRLLCHKRYN